MIEPTLPSTPRNEALFAGLSAREREMFDSAIRDDHGRHFKLFFNSGRKDGKKHTREVFLDNGGRETHLRAVNYMNEPYSHPDVYLTKKGAEGETIQRVAILKGTNRTGPKPLIPGSKPWEESDVMIFGMNVLDDVTGNTIVYEASYSSLDMPLTLQVRFWDKDVEGPDSVHASSRAVKLTNTLWGLSEGSNEVVPDEESNSKFVVSPWSDGFMVVRTRSSEIVSKFTIPKEIEFDYWVQRVQSDDRSWKDLIDEIPVGLAVAQ